MTSDRPLHLILIKPGGTAAKNSGFLFPAACLSGQTVFCIQEDLSDGAAGAEEGLCVQTGGLLHADISCAEVQAVDQLTSTAASLKVKPAPTLTADRHINYGEA